MFPNQQLLTLVVTNNSTFVEGVIKSEVYKGLKKTLRFQPEDAFFKAKHIKSKTNWQWDGFVYLICRSKGYCKCEIKKDGVHFPTGLYSRVVKFFKDNSIPYNTLDKRHMPDKDLSLDMSGECEYRDYQEKFVNACAERERGLGQACTGSGKTFMGAKLIQMLGVAPFIFYVPSIDLLKQTKDEFERFLSKNGKKAKIGMIGDGVFDPQDITIMTIQTAVTACGLEYVKYDEEDKNKSDHTLDEKRREILDLVMSAKGIICDECITGDSIVFVKKYGYVKTEELKNFIGEEILSFNGTSVVWEKITCFMDKGKRNLIEIKFNSGKKIKCTKNHLIKTRKGWIQAGNLKKKDLVLSVVNADAEKRLMLAEEVQANIQNTFLDTRLKREIKISGEKSLKGLIRTLHSVSVDVGRKLHCDIKLWNLLSKTKVIKNIENIFMGMIKDQANGDLNLIYKKNSQFLGLFLEILQCAFQVREVKTQDCHVIMDWFKKNGLNINHRFYIDCLHMEEYIKTLGMAKKVFLSIQDACRVFMKYINICMLTTKRLLIKNGLMVSEKLDWRGGYAMMEAITMDCLDSTQKDTLLKKINSFHSGFAENMEMFVLDHLRENTIILNVEQKLLEKYLKLSQNIFQGACLTKYDEIVSIVDIDKDNVYDITVENTNCFFANGLLVHNCQHWASKTCQVISDYSVSARYKYGFSATVYRDKNDDILIDSCFGKVIQNITASYLIDRGYLVPPTINFVPIGKGNTNGRTYQTIYKNHIVNNTERNNCIANVAAGFEKQGMTTLILVRQISHGKILEKLIPDSYFIHGTHSSKQRKKHLDLMRSEKAPVTIASTIFDEGIDCRPLNALILAGSGKSQTRALQRIGRTLRPYTDEFGNKKLFSTVVDFVDKYKYLQSHSKKRREIYETEPRFTVKELKV